MNEASKTRRLWSERELRILQGDGLDIGCGNDPVLPGVRPFDVEHGDANVITRHVTGTFDFVFSAHCLEHMRDPAAAILEWWKLVRPGGHLFVVVPDEELYEQGWWPSLFNADHKATFTMSTRAPIGSLASVNVFDLVHLLPAAELIDVCLQDDCYDRRCLRGRHCPRWWARLVVRARWKTLKWTGSLGLHLKLNWFAAVFQAPVDQTVTGAAAQIQVIVRKGIA